MKLILITSETCPAPLLAQLRLPLADVGITPSEPSAALGPGFCTPENRQKELGSLKTKQKANKGLIQLFVRDRQKLPDERSECIWFNSKV